MMKYAALALLLVSGGSLAHAQLLGASTSLDVRTGVEAGASGVGVSTDVRATSSDARDNDMATGTDAQSNDSASLGFGNTLAFSLKKQSLDEGTNYSVTEAESVQTAAGLESYAGATVRDDERLEAATLEDDTLTLTYRTDARFLGFIPGSMNVHAAVMSDGTVSVRYPWYAFLMRASESRADLEARLSSEQAAIADDMTEASAMVSAESAEARRWALALERLRSSLHASASAEARR